MEGPKILQGLQVDCKVYLDPTEVAPLLTAAQVERLRKLGAIAGDWSKLPLRSEEPVTLASTSAITTTPLPPWMRSP